MRSDPRSITPASSCCAWCATPATEIVVIEPGQCSVTAAGQTVIGFPRTAPACDQHARVERAPDPRQQRKAAEKEASAWRARQISMSDGRA